MSTEHVHMRSLLNRNEPMCDGIVLPDKLVANHAFVTCQKCLVALDKISSDSEEAIKEQDVSKSLITTPLVEGDNGSRIMEMRKNMGVLIVEDAQGQVQVQLFEDHDKALRLFRELAGRHGDPPSRATLLKVDWERREVAGDFKDLPKGIDDGIDEWILGVGPVRDEGEPKEDDGQG